MGPALVPRLCNWEGHSEVGCLWTRESINQSINCPFLSLASSRSPFSLLCHRNASNELSFPNTVAIRGWFSLACSLRLSFFLPYLVLSCTLTKREGKKNPFPFPWSFSEITFLSQSLISKLFYSLNGVLAPLSTARVSEHYSSMPREEPPKTQFNKLLSSGPPKTQSVMAGRRRLWSSEELL